MDYEIIEWLFFSLAIGFALLSAGFGYHVHKKLNILVFFGIGMLVLTTGRLAEAFELFEVSEISLQFLEA